MPLQTMPTNFKFIDNEEETIPEFVGPCIECDKPSDVGVHGIKNKEAYTERYCNACYFARKFRGATWHDKGQ